ncbi:MAG: hypothetical protein MI756_04675 [Chromatiales bacterium]|nr:hypothetical protein [Chromatiales bacterium]
MSTPNLFTNSATAQSYTAVNSGIDGAQQTEGETLFQQASQSHQPEVLVKRQFEQRNQSQKSKLANEFISSAGREGISQLAATPGGQHALAVVYDHAGSDGRGLMRQVHEEQGNTAVDYTSRQNDRPGSQSVGPLSVSDARVEIGPRPNQSQYGDMISEDRKDWSSAQNTEAAPQKHLENKLVANSINNPPAGAAAGLGFPPLANVVEGSHGTAAKTAVQILETMTNGQPPFKPDVGFAGVQWFVTEGSPYVGRGAENSVTIPVEIEAARGMVQFNETELTRIFKSELEPARQVAEQQYRTRNNLAPDAPLNSKARNTIRFNADRIAERQMWTRVGEQVAHSESGVGQVTLKNSRFSRGGDGTFMLTKQSDTVRVRGGANALVDIIQRTGEPVEPALVEAAKKLATRERWAGRVQNAFRVGGRVLIVVGAVTDGYRIYQADDRVRETTKVAGGWAGASAIGGAFASWASPSLATGPWGWLGYGLGTLGAGAVGYFAGESIAEEAYELIVDGDPIYVGLGD